MSKAALFPGYEVLEDGRVFSVFHDWRGYGHREMVQDPDTDGYPSVRLTVNGRRTRKKVHALVAHAFLPPRPTARHQIRHLDGNKTNNHVSNLMWGTAAENAADRTAHGRTSHGINHSKAIQRGKARAALAKALGESPLPADGRSAA